MAWIKYAAYSTELVLTGSRELLSHPQVAWAAQRISDLLAVKGSASRRDLVSTADVQVDIVE